MKRCLNLEKGLQSTVAKAVNIEGYGKNKVVKFTAKKRKGDGKKTRNGINHR